MSEYVEAIGRNPGEEYGHSHLYKKTEDNGYLPMCRYGWNRSDGAAFSILRGWSGRAGLCKICKKRADADMPPVESKPGSHKTKWI